MIHFPLSRVINDILANPFQIDLISNNVFIITTLPDRFTRRFMEGIYSTGGIYFEKADDFRQGYFWITLLEYDNSMKMIGENTK